MKNKKQFKYNDKEMLVACYKKWRVAGFQSMNIKLKIKKNSKNFYFKTSQKFTT